MNDPSASTEDLDGQSVEEDALPDPPEPTIHYGEANLVLDTTTGKEEEE